MQCADAEYFDEEFTNEFWNAAGLKRRWFFPTVFRVELTSYLFWHLVNYLRQRGYAIDRVRSFMCTCQRDD